MNIPKSIFADLVRRRKSGDTGFAMLVDPDKTSPVRMEYLADACTDAGVDYLLMGGSLLLAHQMDACIQRFKASCDIPVILFPGSPAQVSPYADALLYLSLISGRNPDLLIGQHVASAPMVKSSGLEILPTGYMLIDGGRPTTASYISGTAPLPADKPDIALCTAWAGEMLGLRVLYMDAGSGARQPISSAMIARVAEHTEAPLFIGGGMRTPEDAGLAAASGATVVVVGNALEEDATLLEELVTAVKEGRRVGDKSKGGGYL